MKTQLRKIQAELKRRIIEGDFKVISTKENNVKGYLGSIKINIDDIIFEISISESKTYIACFDPEIKIPSFGWEKGELDQLAKHIEVANLAYKEAQIKKLEDEIRALQAK